MEGRKLFALESINIMRSLDWIFLEHVTYQHKRLQSKLVYYNVY